jgi:hypothetical protein
MQTFTRLVQICEFSFDHSILLFRVANNGSMSYRTWEILLISLGLHLSILFKVKELQPGLKIRGTYLYSIQNSQAHSERCLIRYAHSQSNSP